MTDNIQKILPFLQFESSDDFYYLQILQRKKENPELGSNSRVIKNYYIGSQDYLLSRYEEMKELKRTKDNLGDGLLTILGLFVLLAGFCITVFYFLTEFKPS